MKPTRSQHLITALMACFQAEEGRRITGRRVAEIIDVTPVTISKWVTGKTKLEQVEWLLRLLENLPEDRWLREVQQALRKNGLKKPAQVAGSRRRLP